MNLGACGPVADHEPSERAPSPPVDQPDLKSSEAPEPRAPQPLQRVVPSLYKSCNKNADCALVPSGFVCDGWSYDAISVEHAAGHRERWRNDAAACGPGSTSVHAIDLTPTEYEVRCPDRFSNCMVLPFSDTACHQAAVVGSGRIELPRGGSFVMRAEQDGGYKIVVSGTAKRPRMVRMLFGDCGSTEIAYTDCYRPGTTCTSHFWFDTDERHTIQTDGCEDGCVVNVEYIGFRPVP